MIVAVVVSQVTVLMHQALATIFLSSVLDERCDMRFVILLRDAFRHCQQRQTDRRRHQTNITIE